MGEGGGVGFGGGESLAIYVRQKGLTVFNKVNPRNLEGEA